MDWQCVGGDDNPTRRLTPGGGGRHQVLRGLDRRSMTSPDTDVIITSVVGRRRSNCTRHTQLSPQTKRRRTDTRGYIDVTSQTNDLIFTVGLHVVEINVIK